MLLLSKFIYLLIHPFTWLLITILLWAFLPNKKWSKRAKWTTIFIAFFFSNSVILSEAYLLLEVPSVNKAEIEQYDVGIVLGGMFSYDEDAERLSVRAGADRIWQAIDLYHAKKIDKIAIIGKNGVVGDKWMDESVLLKNQLVEWGIKESDLIIEKESLNTYQNALYTAELFANEYPDYSRFLLITTSYHMKRAQACFEKQGINVTPFPTGKKSKVKRDYKWHQFIIPSPDTMTDYFPLIKEIVGLLAYKIRGYA